MIPRKYPLNIVVATMLPILPSGLAQASSFQILEQSPAHLGKAFAGTGSDVRDASSVFFNPAGISKLDRASATLGVNGIFTNADFSNRNSTTNGVEDETDEIGHVPNLYFTMPISQRIAVGLGVSAPYGLESNFGEDWIGRYLATHSELAVVNLNAVVAYEFNEQWSLGLGMDLQRAEVTLKSQVDSTFGINPQPATDSTAKVEGDDDDIVADASVHFTPNDQTSFGLVWRQGGKFNLDGDASFSLNPICSAGAGFPTGAPPAPTTGTVCAASLSRLAGDASARVHLPDTLTLSGSHRIMDEWQVHADVAWTKWNNIQTIRVRNNDSNLSINELELRYENTLRYAVGFTYEPADCPWLWRFGVAFDEAPQTKPEFVSARIPDEDRVWFSAGFNYEFSPDLSVDAGLAYINVQTATIDNNDPQSGRRVNGTFDANVHVVGVQANWKF
ncbi:MAG: OmpP1/FadL family transporter [Pseudomonadota bacterium]